MPMLINAVKQIYALILQLFIKIAHNSKVNKGNGVILHHDQVARMGICMKYSVDKNLGQHSIKAVFERLPKINFSFPYFDYVVQFRSEEHTSELQSQFHL